jgi:hypothetical protein
VGMGGVVGAHALLVSGRCEGLTVYKTFSSKRFSPATRPMPIPSLRLSRRRALPVTAMAIFLVSTTVEGERTLTAVSPCHIVSSYYPKRICRESADPSECRVATNAFGTREACCRSFGPDGCTPLEGEVECWVSGSRYPTTSCAVTIDPEICTLTHSNWATEDECCKPGNAFTQGCGYQYSAGFSVSEVQDECYISSSFYPQRECDVSTDAGVCQRGWGAWKTYEECCAPNAAHAEGCGAAA